MAKTQSRQDQFVYTCSNCNSNVGTIETRWQCTVCDVNLCANCYTKDGHVHEMQKFGFELGNDSTGEDYKRNLLKSALLVLEHACQCSDANCDGIRCQRMKRFVSHAKKCKRKLSGICPLCKQMIALTCYHSRNCQENKCPVIFCLPIKRKLKKQRMTQQQIPKPQCPQSQMMGANNMPSPAGAAPDTGVGPSQVMATPGTSGLGSKQPRST